MKKFKLDDEARRKLVLAQGGGGLNLASFIDETFAFLFSVRVL